MGDSKLYSAIFPSYRYCVKTRKQGRDAKLVYWKCTEMVSPGNVNTTDNLVTRLPRDQNHPPSHADIKAKLFMLHLPEKARSCLDPLPTLYDNEILQFRYREWEEDTRQIVEKIPTSTAVNPHCIVNAILNYLGSPPPDKTSTYKQNGEKLQQVIMISTTQGGNASLAS
ncbi:Hypothetical predicted protein [Mytilus galloprovincialis]|uniref:FLYWCH-type domain-containing protein n=1 Tax=Mytilus galloprovincialis TaxID=29158 RepID=A0A8B6DTU5_MYTGA|nr:Hypothetical predicted protein [Mytilus galloprovincialis]